MPKLPVPFCIKQCTRLIPPGELFDKQSEHTDKALIFIFTAEIFRQKVLFTDLSMFLVDLMFFVKEKMRVLGA